MHDRTSQIKFDPGIVSYYSFTSAPDEFCGIYIIVLVLNIEVFQIKFS